MMNRRVYWWRGLGERGKMGEKWFQNDYKIKLKDIFELLEIGERSFKKELGDFYNQVETSEEVQKENPALIGLGIIGIEFKLTQDLPILLRQSIFSSSYFLFETILDSLANYLQEKYLIEISPSDLRHNGIIRSKVYCKKVVGISFPDGSKEWQMIKRYNQIRNIIVHQSGEIGYEKIEKIESLVNEIPGLTIDHNQNLRMDDNFCLGVLKTIDNFMKDLFSILDKEKPNWENKPADLY
jgi:hypothetical protein